MELSILENLSGLGGHIFNPSKTPQLHFNKQIENWSISILNSRYTAQPPWAANMLLLCLFCLGVSPHLIGPRSRHPLL